MKRILLLATNCLMLVGSAFGQPSSCPAHFAGGQAPELTNSRLSPRTQELCFEAFSSLHSGVTKSSLYSAEFLNRARIEAARSLKRRNSFHPEEQLRTGDRAELKDYSRSGYDRGHLVPSRDMATEEAQFDSFSLANMIPQDADNNRGLWEGIETSTRNYATRSNGIYVVTGPIYEGSTLKRIGNVLVPTGIFKAIYDPAKRMGAAYVVKNAPGMDYQVLSLEELETRVGLNVFPVVPTASKRSKLSLPEPKPSGYAGKGQKNPKLPDDRQIFRSAYYLKKLINQH